jgi:hypothetical protein
VGGALSTEISENKNGNGNGKEGYKDYCFLGFDAVSFGN